MAYKKDNHYRKGVSVSERHVKPRKKKRKNNGRAIACLTFTFLMIYLIGYIVVFMTKPSVGVETVGYGTIDVPQSFKGIIVRDEQVYKSSISGQPYYNYSENEKVKKGVTVCSIKNVETTGDIEEQITNIDKDILNIQKERSSLSIFKDDIDRIDKNIASAVDTYIPKLASGDYSSIYALRNQLDSQINFRNEIWLSENTKSISELSSEREEYEKKLSLNMSNIVSEKSGILSLSIDGLEDSMTFEGIDAITEDKVNMNVQPSYISKTKTINAAEPVFKIVSANNWYIVSYIPKSVCESWAVGDTITLSAEIDETEKSVDVTIKKIDISDESAKIVFETYRNLIDFISVRTLDFSVSNGLKEGIKIPKNAIVEKTLLKIPSEYITTNEDKDYVIKRSNGIDTSVQVEISSKTAREDNPEAFDCYVLQDFEKLKVGDTIVQGSGESANTYTLDTVLTFKGVFVVNSSIAKFKTIDIIGENNDYAIVSSDSPYGIKVYDNIVSDAKNIKDNDEIF